MGDKVRLLSDAIRLGATIHPQIFSSLFGYEMMGHNIETCGLRITGTCALGATVVAMNKAPETMREMVLNDYYDEIQERWPQMVTMYTKCPACSQRQSCISLITHLNDKHKWSREKIADWLEGIGF